MLYLIFCYLVAKSCPTLGLKFASLLCQWDFPGKNTGVGCYFLLQGIFLTQGSNPHLLHWLADSLPLSRLGSSCYTSLHSKWQSQQPLCSIFFSQFTTLSLHGINLLCPFLYHKSETRELTNEMSPICQFVNMRYIQTVYLLMERQCMK